MTFRAKDLTGRRFGRLVVTGRAGTDHRNSSTWNCLCDCGNTTVLSRRYLLEAKDKSCGCGSGRHGLARTKVYWVWTTMKRRCSDPNQVGYALYGKRGIQVCERWQDFRNFYADMGEPPPGMSIDRIDNDGNYEPGNCRWATRKEQCNNRRNNRRLEYQGKTQTLTQWAEEKGIRNDTLAMRLNAGWPIEYALSKPPDVGVRSNNHKIEFQGRTQTLTQWANEMGIRLDTLAKRLDDGWPIERALTEPLDSDCRLIEFQGRTQTLTQWAEETGVRKDTLALRLKRGWPLERALTEPARRKGKVTQ